MKAIYSLFVLSFALVVHGAPLPVSGLPVPELELIDNKMQYLMGAYDIGAGTIAISRNGVPIYHRSFGWQDEARTVPLAPNAIMRLASVTKPLTAAAVRKLINQGHIGIHQRVFSVDRPGTGILDFTPFGTPDARLKDITVEHLLRHRGGWDRGAPGIPDHTYEERSIALAMGLPSPPGREATTRWIMGKPLQFSPGTDYAYSNIGYLVLGQIVEKVTGEKLIDYVRDEVFTPRAGWPEPQLIHGRTFAADHDPREPYYESNFESSNVFYPAESSDLFVPHAYGGWDNEARIGQGGMVASALTILDYLDRYTIAGNNIGLKRPGPGDWILSHGGSFEGTNAIATQRGDGINFVVLFNERRAGGTSYSSQIDYALNTYFNTNQIPSWPVENITQFPVSVAGDYNYDGEVNIADYVVWRNSRGMSLRLGTGADGDASGIVDDADAGVWAANFGRTLPMPTARSLAGPAYPVPEPSSVVVLTIAAIFVATRSTNAKRDAAHRRR